MKLISPKSKKSFLNLFADFILNKLGRNSDSKIQIVDFENFLVVKGYTDFKDILDLAELKSEFNELYPDFDFKIQNTIDLISYNTNLNEIKDIQITLHQSENCSFHPTQIKNFKDDESKSFDYNSIVSKIEEEDITSSDFPHGYSFSQGRGLFYYIKKITYSIPPNFPFESLHYNLSFDKETKQYSLVVTDLYSKETSETLSSAILDLFNFDISKMKKEFENFNIIEEVLNPLKEHDFLKVPEKDFIII